MRNTRERMISGGTISSSIAGSATSSRVVVPYDCELIAVAMYLTAEIDTAGDEPHTFDIVKNSSTATGVDLIIPQGSGGGSGGRYYLDGKVFLSAGDGVYMTSNSETVSANANCLVGYIVVPT